MDDNFAAGSRVDLDDISFDGESDVCDDDKLRNHEATRHVDFQAHHWTINAIGQ